jgi:hypothetical protein
MTLPQRTSPTYQFYERIVTYAQVNAAVGEYGTPYVAVPDGTTYTVLAADTGKTYLVPDLTGSCTFTLPAVAAGLAYEFQYSGVAADAQNWVIKTAGGSAGNTNFYKGGLIQLKATGPVIAEAAPNGSSNSALTVTTPNVGTRIKLICDGLNWHVSGFVGSATAPSYADQ